ncbi:Protein DEHYDRATION-INDUCED 19 homolog 4 [Striga hermonthica]|uniref:Protein DEHYDRATION-INDUCED 19 homolog 4 n=1 Tax=Striga hermonthica TaxID=68872 RepID=A0A9N7P2Q9_STRHE|nr:Protein DEHYDRATION-INDUCED 19 homolog 4 [Striga hermonthica]
MGDLLHDDLGIVLSSYSEENLHDYDDEDEDTDDDYEADARRQENSDLACPFCPEDFDVLGLCCHIDADHRMEVKPGICPICSTKVRINMASHAKHLRRINEPHSVDSSSPNVPSDSKLMSFINSPNHAQRPQANEAPFSNQESLSAESSNEDLIERIQPTPSTDSNNETRRRCECVQGLVLSTIFDDL